MLIKSFFTENGIPKIGLTPTIRIRNASTGDLVITDESMVEIGDGWYNYEFSSYDPEVEYAGRCDGSISLSGYDRYTYFGNDNLKPTELVTALKDPIADGVWDESIRGSHDIPESAGELLRRPFLQWRCDVPDSLNLEALDPNKTGTAGIAIWIEDQGGYFDGLKIEHITNAGIANIIRVRAGIPTVIDTQNPIVWSNVQDKLKYSVALPTSNLNYGDLMILIISNTRLEINGHEYKMGEFYKTVNVTNSIPLISDVKRLLGLTHENLWTTNNFDIDGNHISTEIQLYDSPTNADTHDGVTGLVAKYTVTVTYLAGKPVSILSKKV